MRRKRLAVFAGQVDESRQSRFVKGLMERAFLLDFDVCFFSMYRKYQDNELREKGEMNIFNLFNPNGFDGVVILKDSIQTSNSSNDLERKLEEEFKGPVLIIDRESEHFPSVFENDYIAMCEVVSHMIEVHGCKDIGFVSGKKWHRHAVSRLDAYKDTMEKHGLTVDENRIFHGDFWYDSGRFAVKQFVQEGGLPEAIVCANDEMAIGVCSALEDMGIDIPGQVAVAGFDSSEEGRLSPKCITSSELPYEDIGSYAAYYMDCKVNGVEPEPYKTRPRFMNGETCGCKEPDLSSYFPRRKIWATNRMEIYVGDIYSMMSRDLMAQNDLEGFFGTLYSYSNQIKDVKRFSLCMCDTWHYLDSDPSIHVKNEGYTPKMFLAVDYNISGTSGGVRLDSSFETEKLLPGLGEEDDKPGAYFFTPVFCESECFGYAVLSFGDLVKSYAPEYRVWIESVSENLETLRRTMELESYRKKVEAIRTNRFAASNRVYENLSEEEKKECDLTARILDENLFSYVYQPIVRASDGEIFSYEALMRSTTEERISPLQIIKYANIMGRLYDVEKATFTNVFTQVSNEAEKFSGKKVFINSIPGMILDNDVVTKLNSIYAKVKSPIVVEMTEETELKDDELERTKQNFKKRGIELAIDDYGTGYSNINNILRYVPNYVKIDRSLLTDIDSKPQKQHFVSEIINFCKDNGILSLAEGIETQEELRTVILMGVDLIQGYYTARPAAEPLQKLDEKVRSQICIYAKEKEDGDEKQVYMAGSSNRISLALLVKYGCTDIVVGKEDAVFKNVSVIGAPNLKTDMNLRVLSGYNGEITLENVCLSNIKGRPSIDILEGANVTLRLEGNSILRGMGIRVHKDSTLRIEGDGNLSIDIDHPKYYGIGNDIESEHGKIFFEQDGKITIHGNGHEGVCIGSGLGGPIKISKGLFVIKCGGTRCCGIGAFDSDHPIEIVNCSIEEDISTNFGLGIGHFDSSSDVYINKSWIRINGGGNKFVGIGSVDGSNSKVKVEDASIEIGIRSNKSTCLGTLKGESNIDLEYAGVTLENTGREAMAFGGVEQHTTLDIENADTHVVLHNNLGKETYASKEDMKIINARLNVLVNEKEVRRELTYG